MIPGFRPPSFVQYDGVGCGEIAGFTLADMYIFADSQVAHTEGSGFYRLLLVDELPDNTLARSQSRKMVVCEDLRRMYVDFCGNGNTMVVRAENRRMVVTKKRMRDKL